MGFMRSRVPLGIENPYRKERPTANKIIFLSCEGSVTEEEYFHRITEIFDGIKSKIQFVSVAEDEVHTLDKFRTREQNSILSKARPLQLVERIEQFKVAKENLYEFSKYPDDEFWVITDVDKNWSNEIINIESNKSYLEEWNEAVALCHEKGYGYAISNPFFEIWLLLHHDDANSIDKGFAVTEEHDYMPTNHFRSRLRELGAPLKNNGKRISFDHYSLEKVMAAVERAESLHVDKEDEFPKYFATTIYQLLNKVIELLPQES